MNAFFFTPPLAALATGLLCLSLSGCNTAPTWVDQHFGQAVQQSQAQPLPTDSEGHAGLQARQHIHTQHQAQAFSALHETDGVSAKAAVDRYHVSLQAPAAASGVLNFNMGAAPAR